MQRHHGKNRLVPYLQHLPLIGDIQCLASRKEAPRIACLADGRLHERTEVPTAPQLVLYPQPAVRAEVPGPLGIDFAFDVELAALVGDVPGQDEENEDNPEEKRVYGKEGAIVEEQAGPTDERGENAQTRAHGGDDQLGPVTDPNDVSILPDVEPGEETHDEADESIKCQLIDGLVSAGSAVLGKIGGTYEGVGET